MNLSSNNLNEIRKINKIESRSIGTKKIVMKMNDDGGTICKEIENNNNCSVTDDHLIQLGEIALEVINLNLIKTFFHFIETFLIGKFVRFINFIEIHVTSNGESKTTKYMCCNHVQSPIWTIHLVNMK